ncbi:MAG: hypothetical protein GKC05_07525 [Methanomicrobiales archaeon]|nr:hypothetical protein [Methanomicrobiales archaeon]
MKKLILVIIAAILMTGYAMADHGIPPVPETQGIVTSTSVNLFGNFASASELQWRITDDWEGLPEIPPLGLFEATIYESTYTEDTQTHGVGLMMYDKELDIETSGQISGQWNIEATKQISFAGGSGYVVESVLHGRPGDLSVCQYEWRILPCVLQPRRGRQHHRHDHRQRPDHHHRSLRHAVRRPPGRAEP